MLSANSLKPIVKDRKHPVLNFASTNFLGLMNHPTLREKAVIGGLRYLESVDETK